MVGAPNIVFSLKLKLQTGNEFVLEEDDAKEPCRQEPNVKQCHMEIQFKYNTDFSL